MDNEGGIVFEHDMDNEGYIVLKHLYHDILYKFIWHAPKIRVQILFDNYNGEMIYFDIRHRQGITKVLRIPAQISMLISWISIKIVFQLA